MDKPSLAPIETLAMSIYPPSAYPPPAFFESSSVIYPAIVIPAKRTGEIQKLLKDLVFQEPKRKSVYPVEEGRDYLADDVTNSGEKYDPGKERKLVLIRLGDENKEQTSGKDPTGTDEQYSSLQEDGAVNTVESDPVFQDPRLLSLLASAEVTASGSSSSTCPHGRRYIRESWVRLPTSPYSLLTVDQVLRRLLPTANHDVCQSDTENNLIDEVPSSFEIAGHIAHVNLRSESLPYKYLIGKAILDKNPRIRVVVNKVGNIENEFRTFPMEIIAGEGLDLEVLERLCVGQTVEDAAVGMFAIDANADPGMKIQFKIGRQHQSLMEVELKEHGCRFKLDFASVYWNSRLQGEHWRLVQYIVRKAEDSRNTRSTGNEKDCTTKQKKCIVADAMAGVGPFAIPLTSANAPHFHRTPIVCHANDLNPVSYKYLQTNAKINKCFADRLLTYNLDAREFIHKMNKDQVEVDHFIMNLPQMAPEFLDSFRGWTFRDTSSRPIVHVHCFDEKARTPEDTIRIETNVLLRCEKALGVSGLFGSIGI
ncbi:hypothetical protein HJC23_002537 [Cyclotella cryptica]|uniref:tRNA (guanine(37)-N1)-methyltransferase n=1 Tax=Cyclotella cryptica TaxID=29204 RepID=A0ABD3QVN6_9STRA|eukprot:CCRYP_001389-RA/>CCRYP_001389-RA protein AED:0.05 eAED:0.05 QI:0/-1/0/1/-1/1/1/0/536